MLIGCASQLLLNPFSHNQFVSMQALLTLSIQIKLIGNKNKANDHVFMIGKTFYSVVRHLGLKC